MKDKMRNAKIGMMVLAAVLLGLSGCGTMDRAYTKQVTWTNAPVVKVTTNAVVTTNLVAEVVERVVADAASIHGRLAARP